MSRVSFWIKRRLHDLLFSGLYFLSILYFLTFLYLLKFLNLHS
jgi:hypothetical protein